MYDQRLYYNADNWNRFELYPDKSDKLVVIVWCGFDIEALMHRIITGNIRLPVHSIISRHFFKEEIFLFSVTSCAV